jgi:hypothetical protein
VIMAHFYFYFCVFLEYNNYMDRFDFPKVRRDAFKIGSLLEPSDEREYWLSKTPQQRLEAVELMRHIIYGDSTSKRLQRVLEVTQRFPENKIHK